NDGKPNSGGPSGVTALHGAAFKGLPEAVQFLVDHGADIWAKDTASERSVAGTPETGRTPLEWAEGISFEGQSPRQKQKRFELLKNLMPASPRKKPKRHRGHRKISLSPLCLCVYLDFALPRTVPKTLFHDTEPIHQREPQIRLRRAIRHADVAPA